MCLEGDGDAVSETVWMCARSKVYHERGEYEPSGVDGGLSRRVAALAVRATSYDVVRRRKRGLGRVRREKEELTAEGLEISVMEDRTVGETEEDERGYANVTRRRRRDNETPLAVMPT